MPDPVEGWVFRYVRVSSLDKSDTKNVSKRFREGWVPIVAQEHPELQVMNEIDSRWPDGIEIGGLLLCKIPEELAIGRRRYNKNLAQQQVESVNAGFMNDQDPRMPKYNDSKSRTQFRKG